MWKGAKEQARMDVGKGGEEGNSPVWKSWESHLIVFYTKGLAQ